MENYALEWPAKVVPVQLSKLKHQAIFINNNGAAQ